jgi:hypothetical protein
MRSIDRFQTSFIRFLPAAALLAALFVPVVAASADEDCPPGGCPLPPPQSREVNPSPAHADGSAVEVPKAAELPPVEITVHVLAPAFVDPAPMGASFETISVPVRYQDPGDVSCGVQALGMAMDALPGAAPTSASLLGLLEGNGMMYDFGTGVEELAYAAHSFGYTGSFAFHGATFEQLQAELALGNPVVVDLGANGEGQPGHFVTVTGISSDGQFVAYNDPTLGEQVISASEFQRLWGLQGNSGVAVATEPPAASGVDAGVLSLWVAFTAGLMALVSTTPLAKFRQGIGGMIVSGGGDAAGVSRVSKPAPAAKVQAQPRAQPAEKEKEKDKASKKSKARFDDEVVGATTPATTTAKPKDDIALPPTPVTTARFDDEIVGVTTPKVSPSTTVVAQESEGGKDPDEKPKPVPTLTPAPPDRSVGSGTPTATATPAVDAESIAAIVTPMPEEPKGYITPELGLPPTGMVEDLLKGTKLTYGAYQINQASAVDFNELASGYLSVTVSDSIAAGEKITLRTDVGYAGTRYSPAGLLDATTDSILDKANGKASVGFAVGIPLAVNLYDYGLGDHKDIGIDSNEFVSSTLVDVGKAAFVGLASAAAVAVGLTLLAGAGVAAVATAPAWAIGLAVILVSVGIGAAIDSMKVNDGQEADEYLKEEVTEGLGAWGGIIDGIGELVGSEADSSSVWRPR